MNKRTPSLFWKDFSNQQAFIQQLFKKLGLKNLDDWYNVTHQDIRRNGGRGLLKIYKDSHIELITQLFPQHTWYKWKFSRTPNKHWESLLHQRQFLEYVSQKLSPQKDFTEKWYSLHLRDLEKLDVPNNILTSYENLYSLLRTLFPEYIWKEDKFPIAEIEQGIWMDKISQRIIFDQVSKQLNIKDLEEWYNITIHTFAQVCPSKSILRYFNGSLIQALKQIYPEYPWKEWKFKQTSEGFWNSLQNQRIFLDDLANSLNLKNWSDWLRVTVEDIRKHGGSTLLLKYNSLQSLLIAAFPENNWKLKKAPSYELANENSIVFTSEYRSRVMENRKEDQLFATIKSLLYPSFTQDIYQKYSLPDIYFPYSNKNIELDIFIPNCKIGIEYQGRQHYQDIPRVSDVTSQHQRDSLKKQECLKNDIVVLEVHHNSWNGSISSLSDILISELNFNLQMNSIYLSNSRLDSVSNLISYIQQHKTNK